MWILLLHYKRIPWGNIIQTEQEQAINFTIPWQYCLIPWVYNIIQACLIPWGNIKQAEQE